ncbi:MAG TPA: DUF2891 domain-containing protein [Mycobacteriales bacterium]|nr:DUF2891 domain-containing protein [Mycobacteriales bacterium]
MTGEPVAATGPDPETVAAYLGQAVAGARREFPNAPGTLLRGPHDLYLPRQSHPAFYGCLDWHSAVHTHWTMARLCRLLPDAPGVPEARAVLADHLTGPNLTAEAAYLADPEHGWFERPYGWAWALALAAELSRWAEDFADPTVLAWSRAIEPLRDTVCAGFTGWLPRLGYPVRAGTHANTAFALLLILDAAPALGPAGAGLANLVRRVAADWFGADEGYPARFEPSGADFLSPCLTEAALMRRVLPATEFPDWLGRFLPELATARPAALFEPVAVPDRGDPHGVHLDGLNLSRAWCWQDLAGALPPTDARRGLAEAAARAHLDAALPYVRTGDFMAEHWLATFAVLATTARAGQRFSQENLAT